MRLKKPEPQDVQGICVLCEVNKQTTVGKGKYRPICAPCHRRRCINKADRFHRKIKGDTCSECGFIPQHPCQLDVDHADGNHFNNEPDNLITLCANCHRLKTYLNKDWEKKKGH